MVSYRYYTSQLLCLYNVSNINIIIQLVVSWLDLLDNKPIIADSLGRLGVNGAFGLNLSGLVSSNLGGDVTLDFWSLWSGWQLPRLGGSSSVAGTDSLWLESLQLRDVEVANQVGSLRRNREGSGKRLSLVSIMIIRKKGRKEGSLIRVFDKVSRKSTIGHSVKNDPNLLLAPHNRNSIHNDLKTILSLDLLGTISSISLYDN